MMSLSNNTFKWFDVPCASNTFNNVGAYVVCQRDIIVQNTSTNATDNSTTTTLPKHTPSCRSFNYTEFEGHCYKFSHSTTTWLEAEGRCLGEGGHLASIHSQEEEQFLGYLSQGNNIWIGGYPSRYARRPEWFWSDSTPMGSLRKVDYSTSPSGCLSLSSVNQKSWHIVPCYDYRLSVCKI